MTALQDRRAKTRRVMRNCMEAFYSSGLTMQEVGDKMGLEPDHSRKQVWQFLKDATDPRISTLMKFSDAVGVPLKTLLEQ